MESPLQGIPGVCIYLDDILVTGTTKAEHLEHLTVVLRRLDEAGMRLKRQKCAFLLLSVEYLGHTISEEGLRTADSKVEAIVKAPTPQNVTELHSFLGQTHTFQEVKKLLQSSQVLVHFDDSRPLVLSCDVSPYGVGAVLAHKVPNGDERPVAFASCTLTETERKYSEF